MDNTTHTTGTITISQTFVRIAGEVEESGYQSSGYVAYNASGKGKVVAVITGPVEVADMGYGCDGGKLDDGQVYALRDVLSFARRGLRGLSVLAR